MFMVFLAAGALNELITQESLAKFQHCNQSENPSSLPPPLFRSAARPSREKLVREVGEYAMRLDALRLGEGVGLGRSWADAEVILKAARVTVNVTPIVVKVFNFIFPRFD